MTNIAVWDEKMEQAVNEVVREEMQRIVTYLLGYPLAVVWANLTTTGYVDHMVERIRQVVHGRRVLSSEPGWLEHDDVGPEYSPDKNTIVSTEWFEFWIDGLVGTDKQPVDVLVVERF